MLLLCSCNRHISYMHVIKSAVADQAVLVIVICGCIDRADDASAAQPLWHTEAWHTWYVVVRLLERQGVVYSFQMMIWFHTHAAFMQKLYDWLSLLLHDTDTISQQATLHKNQHKCHHCHPLPVSCNLMHYGLPFLWGPFHSLEAYESTPLSCFGHDCRLTLVIVCDRLHLQCRFSDFSSTRGDYGQGDKREKFRFARTLVLIQCVISALFAEICKYALYIRDTCLMRIQVCFGL